MGLSRYDWVVVYEDYKDKYKMVTISGETLSEALLDLALEINENSIISITRGDFSK